MDTSEALKSVRSYLKGLRFSADKSNAVRGFSWFTYEELGGMTLMGTELIDFETCLNKLVPTLRKEEPYSRKGFETLLQKTMLKAWDHEEGITVLSEVKINKAVDWLKAELKRPPDTYIICFPVMGIDQASLPSKFGKFSFLPADDHHLGSLIKSIHDTVMATRDAEEVDSAVAAEQKEALAKILTDRVDHNFRGNTIAELEVRAGDHDNAKEKGYRECRRTLDVINFYADILETSGNACVSLLGEGQQVIQLVRDEDRHKQVVVFREEKNGDGTYPDYREKRINNSILSGYTNPPYVSLKLPSLESPQATKLGFARVSELLGNENNNTLDNRILAAFQWAVRATVDNRKEEAFLLFTIALESLVIGKKDQEIGFRFKNAVVHLIRKTLEDRIQLFKRLGELYATRSGIVHAGNFQVTDSAVKEVESYTKIACLTLVTDERFRGMNTGDALDEWFHHANLSGSVCKEPGVGQ